MTSSDHRLLVADLASDYSWLERYARDGARIEIPFASALVRNVIGPHLDKQDGWPLYVAVVGGAGTGKSTVVNLILGTVVTESNAQAGYTRHPIAYGNPPRGMNSAGLGFLGDLKRLEEVVHANLDEDVYQFRRVTPVQSPLPDDLIVWDLPDVTTMASQGYVKRVIEVLALADLVVFVASDERYNDAVPTRFLQLVLSAGKAVVVCLTKMREAEAPTIVQHFRDEVLKKAATPGEADRVPIVAIPYQPVEVLQDPAGKGAPIRIPLLNQLSVLLQPEAEVHHRTLKRGVEFLKALNPHLLELGQGDLLAYDQWKELVASGKGDFEQAYHREYRDPSGTLERTPEQMMSRLEFTGGAKGVSIALWALRLPYRLVEQGVQKMMQRPAGYRFKETDVISRGLGAWLDRVRARAVQRAGEKGVWAQIAGGFNEGLAKDTLAVYESNLPAYQAACDEELQKANRELLGPLDGSSPMWNTLRLVKAGLEIVAAGLGFYVGNLGWLTLLTVPVFVSIVHLAFQIGISQYVEMKRRRVRDERLKILDRIILTPFAQKLEARPMGTGSDFERLSRLVTDLPARLESVREVVGK